MMRFRMYCALSGISRFSASSTERTEAIACTVVQTPQKRCVKAHASRGSRPRRIFSMPRHIVAEAQAFCTAPLSTSTSTRRWPSIRVIGPMISRCAMFVDPQFRIFRLQIRDVLVPVGGGGGENGEPPGRPDEENDRQSDVPEAHQQLRDLREVN